MNTIVKTSIYAALAATFLTVAIAGPAVAKTKIRFYGFFQGSETEDIQGTTALIAGRGTGLATTLGQFTVIWNATVDLTKASGTGHFHLIAADGDSIFAEDRGQSEETGTSGVVHIVEINTITGGTGQFAGATGDFTVDRLVDLTTGFSSGSLSGKITTPE